ncbi:family A G protein-coupled receptor-like protein [Conidiobolus coronatus NRRL 28638]|uniref:Family A G protein-coupled receptor-like protein n=1 Tax=Conidiobolus coronatus (strain ATCC 28846 / CBS 209.66 / NRRL 28638) TaxID=796925 RepID=A0A137NPH6_CONC2|nr:family A G protein-coupled receptor-like protein [Conidiobolus coronatus NRRL 28638]|eukprot:KXN64639.1 family A G protein-coupled receptor-like protein [Conidiobolus coronatus NRRL 28638]
MLDINDLDFIRYFFNSIFLLFSVIMIPLNLIILYILKFKCEFKRTEITLMFILSIVELFSGFSLFVIPLCLIIIGKPFFEKGSATCQFAVVSYNILIRTGVCIVCIISVMRYLVVCHNIRLPKWIWLTITTVCLSPIIGTFSYTISVMDGRPSPSYIQCGGLGNGTEVANTLQIFGGVYMAIQAWLITVAYLLICYNVYKKLNTVLKEAKMSDDRETCTSLYRQRNNLFGQVALIIWVYNITYMFSYVTQVLKVTIGYKRTPFLDAVVMMMIMFPCLCNPIVTLSFQPEVKCEFQALMVRFWARMKAFFHR